MSLKWLSGIGKLNKLDIFSRLNITQDGTLEIDGQPQQSTGGGNAELLAIKEVWSGSANITKTFTDSMYGFDITNDGSSDLTFTINGLTITVKAGEVFSDIFEAFTSVTITTSVSYRACVKESLNGTPSQSNDTTAPVISISPASGTYTGSQQITLSSNETANIYYTIDGSTPTTSSTNYTAPFTLSSTATIKYFGVDSSGNSSIAQSANFTINAPDITAPNPVTNLVAGTVTNTSIPVSWALSTSTDVANYEVAYSTDGTNFTVASNAINSSSTSYTVSGLTANTNYTIRVIVIDTSGNRSTSVTVTATTAVPADTTPPNDVTNLTASNVTDISLTLTWTASTSTDIASYDVYKGTTLLGNTTSTTYNVAGLTASTSYTFKVVSKDTSGNASIGVTITESTIASTPANDTTPPTITASPVGGTYTSSQSVTLTANETATIYYTTDGTTPTTSSSVYSSPISVNATTTLKYFGVDSTGNQSVVQTQTYTINIPVSVSITDSFNRANGTLTTTDTGQTWNLLNGTWSVSNNQAILSTNTSAAIAVIDAGITDVTISADITWSNNAGLALRVQDKDNYLFLRLYSNQLQLYKSVSGVSTLIKSASYTTTTGTTYNLKAELRGGTIDAYVNNTLVFESYSLDFPIATQYGFRQSNNTTTEYYDNFSVQSLSAVDTSSYVVYDDFDRADSTISLGKANTGQTWSALQSTWGIINKTSYQVGGTTGDTALAVVESSKSDVTIEVLEYVQFNGGIAFRISDTSNYFFCRYGSSSQWELYKIQNGTSTMLGTPVSENSSSVIGATRQLKIVTNGSNIEFFVDGVSKITATDTFNQTATKHGLREVINTSNLIYYDNFTIQ